MIIILQQKIKISRKDYKKTSQKRCLLQTLNGQRFRDLTLDLTFQAFIIMSIMSKIELL